MIPYLNSHLRDLHRSLLAHRVAAADLVVPTIDTVRHEMLLSAWLSEHKPLVLCGPPGSGKVNRRLIRRMVQFLQSMRFRQ